jgi:uncharacterized Tic20 family protein
MVISMDQETRNWAMLLHLSILLGTAFPVVGMIVPIVIWQWKRETLPMIDEHGKMAANFIISMLVYWLALAAIGFMTCGLFGLIYIAVAILGIVGVVFPLIAAMKANQGIFWRYPYIYNWIR